MMTKKRSLLMLLQLAVAYLFVACVSIIMPDVFLLRLSATLVLLAFSLALMMYFDDHIIDPGTRKYLMSIAGLIVAWIILRGAKYIAFEETGIIARHIWYFYYLPALFIPLLSLFAALSVGEGRQQKPRWKVRIAITVTLLLALMVLTNDMHQLVFRFHPGFADWDADYSHAFAFYLIYGWIALLFIDAVYILFSRCRVSASRKLVWVPMLPALFGIVYLALYAAGLWPKVNGTHLGEFPEAVCFTMAGIWLSLMYIGLIPSNVRYGRLFELSGLSAQIAGQDYRIIYRSPTAASLSLQELRAGTDISRDTNTRIHRKRVHGGFVYWQDDITELNRINEELWETGERLSEETEPLRLENELKEERAQIEAKTKTYDEIAEKVSNQSRRISELCSCAEQIPESYAVQMRTVCLLAVYIKRFANLSLLAADSASIDSAELYLAVQESLRYVSDMGIPAESSISESAMIDAQSLLKGYALFEQLLEQALPALRGVQVSLRRDALKCTFEGTALTLSDGSSASMTEEDGCSFVRIPLKKAGEAL